MNSAENNGFYSNQTEKRMCCRAFGRRTDGSDIVCEQPADFHVMLQNMTWTPTIYLCDEHKKEYERNGTPHFNIHPLVPDCGMPGAVFHTDKNRCIVDWPEILTEEEKALVDAPVEREMVLTP